MEAYHTQNPLSSHETPDTGVGKVRSDGRPSRTRARTWVPRRVYYVLAFLKRQLAPGTPHPLSNKQIQLGVNFGSEGEVSQIMRWLAGEQPTMGRWAYGALNTNAQVYRFIDRERMPRGGYRITLLATPERIDAPRIALPSVVQLSFFERENDPPMIPHAAHQDASQGGSFFHDPFGGVDRAHAAAPKGGSQRDQHEETHEESNSSSVSAQPKNDWSQITIGGGAFLPIAALEKAGITPQIFQDAERKIVTRHEYDRPAQVRILIRSLLTHQPIYSAAEIAAREEPRHEHPARSAAASGTRRRSAKNQPERAADPTTPAEYAALLAEIRAARPLTAEELGLPVPGQRRAAYGS